MGTAIIQPDIMRQAWRAAARMRLRRLEACSGSMARRKTPGREDFGAAGASLTKLSPGAAEISRPPWGYLGDLEAVRTILRGPVRRRQMLDQMHIQ